MGKHIHKLTGVDVTELLADCQECGRVQIRIKGSARVPRCINSIRVHKGPGGPELQPHGLTDRQAKAFREGKACSICGSTQRLTVDHCHKGKFIRGVLCHSCNVGIGLFKDDPQILEAAIKYLTQATPKSQLV